MFSNRICLAVVLIFIGCAIPFSGFAEDESPVISTDRPGFGDSSSIVPEEHLQLEAGARVNHEIGTDRLSFPELLVRYGVTDSLEIRALPPVIDIDQFRSDGTDTDPTPFGIGAKLGTELTDKLSLAGIANATIPIRSKQDPAFSLAGALSHSNSKSPVGLTIYGGVEGTDHSGDPGANLFASLSPSVTITDKFGAFAELYWVVPEGQTQIFADGGLTYLVKDNFQVDLHGGLQLPHEEDSYFVGLGFGWLI